MGQFSQDNERLFERMRAEGQHRALEAAKKSCQNAATAVTLANKARKAVEDLCEFTGTFPLGGDLQAARSAVNDAMKSALLLAHDADERYDALTREVTDRP